MSDQNVQISLRELYILRKHIEICEKYTIRSRNLDILADKLEFESFLAVRVWIGSKVIRGVG